MAEPTVTKTWRAQPSLARKLAMIAAREGTSENYEISVAVRVHVDNYERQRKGAKP